MPRVARRQQHCLDMGQVMHDRAESAIANLCTTGASATLAEQLLRVASATAEMRGERHSKVAKKRIVEGYVIRRSCNTKGALCFNFRATKVAQTCWDRDAMTKLGSHLARFCVRRDKDVSS